MGKRFIFSIFVAYICFSIVRSKLIFNNIKCDALDETKLHFDTCVLKSVNRTYKYLTIVGKFLKPEPVNDIKVNLAVLRKENGYKPFLYNITIDACKYLKNRNTNKVIRFAHSFFEKYSNLNRTCPYGEHDIIVYQLPVSYINNLLTNVLPTPHGDYAAVTTFYFYSKNIARVSVYASLS